jgi:hypothetical protein
MAARTELNVQEVDRDGLKVTYVSGDATNDHSWDNRSEDIFVHLINGGGSACVATFLTPKTVDGLLVADLIVSVPAGEDWFIGPFRNDLYGQEDADAEITKAVLLDLDQDTTVTLAALKLGDVNF